jgi:YesN/AraC family two-component response regulator
MFRVMLIDDEEPTRLLLKKSIDWKSLGLEVIGEAGSGIEAINKIDDLRPHIVFVDICMPFMGGIEFAKLATSRYPRMKIIILTAFDEFEYARQCIGMPVCGYILKPIVRSEIFGLLKKVVKSVEEPFRESDAEPEIEPSAIRRIARYVEENYTDSSLNLTSIAQTFGFNSSYLSRRFKTEIGVSFTEHLTECRMNKALQMVKDNQKMFSTANAVGIPDPNYFGRCFRKYTGISYSEYDKHNAGIEASRIQTNVPSWMMDRND